MSNLFQSVDNLREQYKLLTTLLWKNDHRVAAFTVSRTDRTDIHQFYWYTREHGTKSKIERLYYAIPEGIFIDYEGELYKVVQVAHYIPATSTQVLLQLQHTEDSTSYLDYMGYAIPKKDAPAVPVYEPQKAKHVLSGVQNYAMRSSRKVP